MSASSDLYSRPDVPRADRPVRVGSLLFTIVEPRKGYEVAYNRWYERDHFYSGCMIGSAQFAGNRFVATRDCKALRPERSNSADPDPKSGSYVAIYWVEDGKHDEWNKWAVDQVNWLHANKRMFLERDHYHTRLYKYIAEFNAPGSTMPSELALDRAYPGIVAMLLEPAPGVTADKIKAFHAARTCPSDVMVLAESLPLLGGQPADVPKSDAVDYVHIFFSAEHPLSVWKERYEPLIAEMAKAGLGRLKFASPFITTVKGTDQYTDQLW